jgi:hypothetical protein
VRLPPYVPRVRTIFNWSRSRLTYAANSGGVVGPPAPSQLLVLEGAQFDHLWLTFQSQKKGSTRYLTYKQRSDTMRGNIKGRQLHSEPYCKCIESRFLGLVVRAFDVGLLSSRPAQDAAIPGRSSDISSPLRISIIGNYVVINGLPLDPRATVTLSLLSAYLQLQ